MKKIKSKYNGTLEINTLDGRKVLDTEQFNYSYGNAQKVLRFALRKADLRAVRKVLLCGLGGGSVIDLLRNEFAYTGHITAVELDPVIVEIAEEEFGIGEDALHTIVCGDAYEYVLKSRQKFDLIFVDVSLDFLLPEPFLRADFWNAVVKRSNATATVLFNALSGKQDLSTMQAAFAEGAFTLNKHRRVNGSNTVFVAHRKANG